MENPDCLVANVLDCDIVVIEYDLKLMTNANKRGVKLLNSTITVILKA